MLKLSAVVLALSVSLSITTAAKAHLMLPADLCQKVDWANLSKSVVSLRLLYDQPDEDGNVGRQGTAWFVDSTHLATISHISDDVISETWRAVTVMSGTEVRMPATKSFETEVRLIKTIDVGLSEKISLIELKDKVPDSVSATIRANPVENNEPVVGVGYRGDEPTLQYAVGHFGMPEPSGEPDPDAKPLEPFLYFELSDEKGEDRKVFDHGTSGAPLFDCEGEVVAIISNIRTTPVEEIEAMWQLLQTLEKFNKTLPGNPLGKQIADMKSGITPPWGGPNNTAVPASPLLSHMPKE